MKLTPSYKGNRAIVIRAIELVDSFHVVLCTTLIKFMVEN